MIDKKYLPSKSFVKTLSVSVIIILIAIVLNYWRPSTTNYTNQNIVEISSSTSLSANNIDTDGDSLPDWLENLYGTNPNKTDTDGDGTNDAVEVSQNRDPLKANTAKAGQEPNDKVDPKIIAQDQKVADEYTSLNATEKMSRNLMSNIIASTPADGSQIDQNTVNALIEKSLQDIPSKDYIGITKESDLNLIKIDESTFNTDIAKYTNVYYTQTQLFANISGTDVTLIENYLATGKDIKKDLLKITSQYQSIINNLIKVPVPANPGSDGAVYHLVIINDIEKLIQADNDILNSSSKDIASVFSDLSVYNSTINELMFAFDTLDSILKIKR